MSRAGREPAEDVKRRFVTACQEVGLDIQSANMIRNRDDGSRLILVGAVPSGWAHDTPMLSLMTNVSSSGDWTRTVDVRCVATDEDPATAQAPWMQGRGEVPLGELIEQLRETLAEREQVMAAIKAGQRGPFEFQRSVWKIVDLFSDMDFCTESD
ncbi:MAG: hypothetical protein H8E44_35190 [Planctomycetes bacterium]|nr:hypothetical protein [Planctomycetota bacterium]MBL7038799.1 hypothetical protein [Pirellulaceae bacterium]